MPPLPSTPRPAGDEAAALVRQRHILAWMDLMRTCDEFLRAGLRRQIGPDGDLAAAYRRWYERWAEEHERGLLSMVENFNRRRGSDAS